MPTDYQVFNCFRVIKPSDIRSIVDEVSDVVFNRSVEYIPLFKSTSLYHKMSVPYNIKEAIWELVLKRGLDYDPAISFTQVSRLAGKVECKLIVKIKRYAKKHIVRYFYLLTPVLVVV